jgi:hypothetical protein
MTLFAVKAFLFRWRRRIVEIAGEQRARRWEKGASLSAVPVVSRSLSPLWNPLTGPKEYALTAGKIHNLRLAAAAMTRSKPVLWRRGHSRVPLTQFRRRA